MVRAMRTLDAQAQPAQEPQEERFGAEGGLLAGQVKGKAINFPLSKGQMADMAVEGGLGAAGQGAGLAFGPAAPVAVPALGALGGGTGNIIAQLRQIKMGERKDFSVGEFIAATAMSAIPGEPMAGATAKTVFRAAGKQGAAALGGATITTGIDEGRLPTPTEAVISTGLGAVGGTYGAISDTSQAITKAQKRAIQNAVEDETIRLATAAGYKIDPTKIKPGAVISALDYIGGKANNAAEYARHNANVTLALAKKSIGLDVSDVLDINAIKQQKTKALQTYKAIDNVSPRAQAALEQHIKANELAHSYSMDAKSPMPGNRADSREQAELWAERAENAWKDVEDELQKAGKTDLSKQFAEAKKRIAKTHVVLEAFNEGSGKVSAQIISKARESRGALLDGELEQIHKFAQAFPEEASNDVSKKQGGVVFNRLTTLAALGATAHYGGLPSAALLGGVAVGAPPIARSILSDPNINRMLATRSYDVAMGQNLSSLALQRAIASIGIPRTEEDREPITKPVPFLEFFQPKR